MADPKFNIKGFIVVANDNQSLMGNDNLITRRC